MTGLELARPRDVSALFADSLGVYFRNARAFLPLSAAVVVPVHLVVDGVGMEELTSGYDSSPSPVETVIPTLVSFLVVAPLITAICIHALNDLASGERPRVRAALLTGLEAFAPIFFAVVLMGIGVAIGLVLLVLPGIYLAVRWYFVPQTVMIDGARGTGALDRSGELVRGSWWRTFGLIVMANLAAILPALLLVAPFDALADDSDRAVWSLVGTMATETITAPFVALFSTLLYYDLRARRRAALDLVPLGHRVLTGALGDCCERLGVGVELVEPELGREVGSARVLEDPVGRLIGEVGRGGSGALWGELPADVLDRRVALLHRSLAPVAAVGELGRGVSKSSDRRPGCRPARRSYRLHRRRPLRTPAARSRGEEREHDPPAATQARHGYSSATRFLRASAWATPRTAPRRPAQKRAVRRVVPGLGGRLHQSQSVGPVSSSGPFAQSTM